jgi:hypothetical protein
MLTFDDFLIGMSVRPEHPAADGVPRGERPAGLNEAADEVKRSGCARRAAFLCAIRRRRE